MNQFLTEDIAINVEPTYSDHHSNPEQRNYIFSYRIAITNNSQAAVQLLSRHWFIYDTSGEYSEVEGEGVIGKQPVIKPFETFTYESFCSLRTDIGWMWGSYLMKNTSTDKSFLVEIPEFELIRPVRLN